MVRLVADGGSVGDDRRAADPAIERARDGQQRVAHRLEIEPLTIEPPDQPVLGVALERVGPRQTALLIRAREHDPPVQRLERPAGRDELGGQVVEQLGMAGRVAAHAEVAGRRDQPLAEMPLPHAVDQHAGRQRVLGVGDGPGQIEPAAPFGERSTVRARQHLQEPPRDRRARPSRIAANEDVRVDRLRRVDKHHRPRGAPGCVPFDLGDLAVKFDSGDRAGSGRGASASLRRKRRAVRSDQKRLSERLPLAARQSAVCAGDLAAWSFDLRVELGEKTRVARDDFGHGLGRTREHRLGDQWVHRRRRRPWKPVSLA